MLTDAKHDGRLARLTDRLRLSPAVSPDLMAGVISDVCTRLPLLKKAGKTARIDQLLAAGAWNDVALALIEAELPAWKLRRLVDEDGEWLCSLSRELNLPLALDDTADGRHDVLPLAILTAFVEARRVTGVAPEPDSPTVPQIRSTWGHAVCCDNFA